MGEFSDVIRTIETMKVDGVISEYAIGGAMAFAFWNEPIYTEWKLDPSTYTLRRAERAARLFEAGATTSEEVEALLERYRDV